jgi:hypothetical protein
MPEPAVTPLARWENFYVIVGSAAGALIGLQFVAMALIADRETPVTAGSMEIRAFGTPNVVHFSAALLIAAVASAPWHAVSSAAVAFGVCGAAGVAYGISVIGHARRQSGYKPDREDWIWYVVLPLLAYAMLLCAAYFVPRHADQSLFVVAAAALLLVLVGIHNAWDTVTYVTAMRRGHGRIGQRDDTGK